MLAGHDVTFFKNFIKQGSFSYEYFERTNTLNSFMIVKISMCTIAAIEYVTALYFYR